MLAHRWPPVTYWLQADDRMVATAVDLLEAEADQLRRARGEEEDDGV